MRNCNECRTAYICAGLGKDYIKKVKYEKKHKDLAPLNVKFVSNFNPLDGVALAS